MTKIVEFSECLFMFTMHICGTVLSIAAAVIFYREWKRIVRMVASKKITELTKDD